MKVPAEAFESRVLIFAPLGNDARNAADVLATAGFANQVCPSVTQLVAEARIGAAALILTQECLTKEGFSEILELLRTQPPWSDLPLILIGSEEHSTARYRVIQMLESSGNVTLLERPLTVEVLTNALRVAWRARRRQYQIRDLIEQRESILTSISDGFASLDLEGRFTYVNERAAQMFGEGRHSLMDKMIWDIFPGLPESEFGVLLRQAYTTRQFASGELSIEPWNGWFDVRIYPSRFGLSLFLADITKRKHVEMALREAQEDLSRYAEELEKRVQDRTAKLQDKIAELEAFSYTVSHDLRQPLRALQAYSQALIEDYESRLDEGGKRYLERISKAAMRLDQLTQDVLAYSRVARNEFQLSSVNLDRLLNEILEEYPGFQSPAASVRVQQPLGHVVGNEALLTQCLSNLLGNAVKFVAPGVKPEVKVWSQPNGTHVKLFMRDNGIGIAPEHHTRIFGIFEQVHGSKKYEGSGIGLAIVRKATERMGGRVGLDSQLGEGSTFWLELKKP